MISAIKNNYIGSLCRQSPNRLAGTSATDEDRAGPVLPVDRVTLSPQALRAASRNSVGNGLPGDLDLTPEEREEVSDLKQRDTEVKAHEQAHMAAGSGLTNGGATYQYETGPDGKRYAVGGEVNIDLSSAGSPEATIRKMQQIQAAALAPAQPSGTDRAVAAQAAQIEAAARLEKSREKEDPSGQAPAEVRSRDARAGEVPNGQRIDLMV